MDKRIIMRASDLPQRRLTVRPEELQVRYPLKQAIDQMAAGEPLREGAHIRWTFDGPPDMKPVPPDAPDLVGIKWGRLVVVGLLDKSMSPGRHGGGAKASWVVRCACGTYETRAARTIRAQVEQDECCSRCERVKRNFAVSKFLKDGKWPNEL